MKKLSLTAGGLAAVALAAAAFVALPDGQSAPAAAPSAPPISATAATPSHDSQPMVMHVTQLGYTDEIIVDIASCKVTSDTTHQATTVTKVVHGTGEGNGEPYTKHTCTPQWPTSLSTIGWAAGDIATGTFYNSVACGHPLASSPNYSPCFRPDGSYYYPSAYKEGGGEMTIVLLNSNNPADTRPVPEGLYSPAVLTTWVPASDPALS